MRKIGRSELVLWKCPTCGSRNKIYTILKDCAGNRIGSTLKCCNCGTLLKRLNDVDATVINENSKSLPSEQYCIKLHWCKNCKTCKLNNKNNTNTDINDCTNSCCNCDLCSYKALCEKIKSCKLTININKSQKYL